MNTYTPTPDFYNYLTHSGVKGMEWAKHKYLKKINGSYSYGDKNNTGGNIDKTKIQMYKKMQVQKYTSQNTKTDTKGSSVKNTKNNRNTESNDSKSQAKVMQYKQYRKYLDSLEDKKNAMSFEEFVDFMNKKQEKMDSKQQPSKERSSTKLKSLSRKEDIPRSSSKTKETADDKFRMMREMAIRKLKAKYKK